MKPDKEFIQKIARNAGKIVMKHYGKASVSHTKSDEKQIVTKADLESEEYIIKTIKQKYPSHGFIAEESGEEHKDKDGVWIIDPIDGTTNFSQNLPLFAVIIGFAWKGEITHSCHYFPKLNELYYAEKGKGAFLNGKKIKCSDKASVDNSSGLVPGYASKKVHEHLRKIISSQDDKSIQLSIYICASAEFSFLANGRKDWYMTFNYSAWDIGPGTLLCAEAGCKVEFLDGSKYRLDKKGLLLIANPTLHTKIKNIITK